MVKGSILILKCSVLILKVSYNYTSITKVKKSLNFKYINYL